mgnify:CR=1 FL=1
MPGESEGRTVLGLHPALAPIKAGIFPLVNKDGMPEVAEKIYLELRKHFTCEYDAKQSIGKRYARMDEAGCPFCFTIDGETRPLPFVEDIAVPPDRLYEFLVQVQKVFHHAPFDLRFMVAQWNVTPRNIACTKVASKMLSGAGTIWK